MNEKLEPPEGYVFLCAHCAKDIGIELSQDDEKELTDEEIVETVKDHFIGAIKVGIVLTNDNVLDFARAILRKAQEK